MVWFGLVGLVWLVWFGLVWFGIIYIYLLTAKIFVTAKIFDEAKKPYEAALRLDIMDN